MGRVPVGMGEWVLWVWGVGGVLAFILQAVVRLGPRAWSTLASELTVLQISVAVVWTGFMLYAEAWRGFHQRFSPRVVARATGLLDRCGWVHALLAPAVAMGLIYATRTRMFVSRLVLVMILCLVVVVRQLPDPWRGIVDFGVVAGLVAGMVSIVWYAVQALRGQPLPIASDFPEEAA